MEMLGKRMVVGEDRRQRQQAQGVLSNSNNRLNTYAPPKLTAEMAFKELSENRTVNGDENDLRPAQLL